MKLTLFVCSWLFVLPVLYLPSTLPAVARSAKEGVYQQPAFALRASAGKPSTVVEWQTEQEHDFGTIHQGRPVRFAFIFKNTSKEPVVLETVRTSCGCTAAQWPEEAIAPGETGEVKIEYDAYLGGAFRKKIKVFFAQQKKPEILWISGAAE